MTTRFFWILAFIILALGLGVRVWKLGEVPNSLYWDEVAMYIDARSLAQTGQDMHGRSMWQEMYPSYGDYKLPVYILLSAPFSLLPVSPEVSIRMVSVLAGLGTIVLGGLLARKLLELTAAHAKASKQTKQDHNNEARLIQLATMFVIAISPWSIMFSRTAFEGHLSQFLLSLSIYITLAGWKRNRYLLLSALLGAVATYTYYSTRFVWPVIFILAALFARPSFSMISKTGYLQTHIKQLGVIGVAIAFFLLLLIPLQQSNLFEPSQRLRLSTPSVLNDESYPMTSNIYRELAGNTTLDRLFFHRDLLALRQLASNVSEHLSLEYLFLQGDDNLRHGTREFGVYFLPLSLALLTALTTIWKRHWSVGVLLLGWWLVALIPASVPNQAPHALRSLNALVPVSILIAYGLTQFLIHTQRKWRLIGLGISLAALFSFARFSHYYFTVYPEVSAPAWQAGYREFAQLILNTAGSHPEHIWVDGPDDRFFLWVLAYGDWEPDEIQHTGKIGYSSSSIQNIYFRTPEPEDLDSQTQLYAGETQSLLKNMEESGVKYEVIGNVSPSYIDKTYSIVLVETPQKVSQ